MVRLLGDADRLKSGVVTEFTVNVTVVVCVMPPPMPVTVIGYVPIAVVEATAMVIVEVPDPGAAMDGGVKLTVTPAGCPVADKATAELKPPEIATVTVDVPLLPGATDTEPGDADTVKVGVVGARASIKLTPFGLPHPVTRS